MKQKTFSLIISFLLIFISYGQPPNLPKATAYFGPGIGLDYGGLGLKFEYIVVKNLGLFGGAGYNFSGLGVNGGISCKILPDKKSTPMLMAMYGYNAVINVGSSFGSRSSETYYGFSTGIGYEFFVGRLNNKLSLALLIPFRSTDFKNQYNALRDAGYTFSPDVLPVLVSVGFNIARYGRYK